MKNQYESSKQFVVSNNSDDSSSARDATSLRTREREHEHRAMAFKQFNTSLKEVFTKGEKIIPRDDFHFGMFDRWMDMVSLWEVSFEKFRRGDYRSRRVSYRLRFRVLPSARDTVISGIQGSKEDQAYQIISQLINPICVQMESDDAQVSTVVATDTTNFITAPAQTLDATKAPTNLDLICDGDGPTRLPIATNKMEFYKSYTLSTNTPVGTLVSLTLPEAFHNNKSAISMLNRNFAYSKPVMEVEVSTTAVVQGCGALIIGVIPDAHQNLDTYHNHPWTTYQRNKALDPSGNGGVLQLNGPKTQIIRIANPFRNNFVRNAETAAALKGVLRSNTCTLLVQVLDTYKVGVNVPSSIKVTLRYRFIDNPMYALTYTQGLITDVAETVIPEIVAAEKLLKRAGIIVNEDKPYDDKVIINRPLAIHHFSSSVGTSPATPLAMDPLSTTTLHPAEEMPFTTTLDIARVDGFETKLEWKKDHAPWTLLMDKAVNPSIIDKKELNVSFVPSPLCAMSNMYNYWTGDIIYTFTVLSSGQHTGALTATVQYALPDATPADLSASHTTTFTLSPTQNSFEVLVKYKYDTMMRRNNIVMDYPLIRNNGVIDIDPSLHLGELASRLYSTLTPLGLFARSRTRITLSVSEPLLCSELSSSSVSILVSCRAAPNFKLHELVASQLIHPYRYSIPDGKMDAMTYGKFPSMALNKYSKASDPPISNTSHIELTNVGPDNSREGVSIPTKYTIFKRVRATDKKTEVDKFVFQGENFVEKNTNDEITIKNILRSKVRVCSITIPQLVHTAKKNDAGLYGRDEDTLMRLDAQGRPCNIYGDIRQWYLLPIFPLNQRDMRAPFNRSCAAPSALLGTIHRHFNGDIRVTINVKTATDKPVYVSKLPCAGFNIAGVHRVYISAKGVESHDDASWTKCSALTDMLLPIDAGYRTTIINPKVNPWGELTFMDSNNLNRIVTGRRVRDKDNIGIYPRNETDNILGHLVLCCEDEVEADIYFEYGDRAELSTFMGFPEYVQTLVKLPTDDFTRISVGSSKHFKVDFQFNQVSATTKLDRTKLSGTKNRPLPPKITQNKLRPIPFGQTMTMVNDPSKRAQLDDAVTNFNATSNEINNNVHLLYPEAEPLKLYPFPVEQIYPKWTFIEKFDESVGYQYLLVGFANLRLIPVFPFRGKLNNWNDIYGYIREHQLNYETIVKLAVDETPDYTGAKAKEKMAKLNLPKFKIGESYKLFTAENAVEKYWSYINIPLNEVQMENAAMAVGTVAGLAAGTLFLKKTCATVDQVGLAAEGMSSLMGRLNSTLDQAGVHLVEARNSICHQVESIGKSLNSMGENFTFKKIVSILVDVILLIRNFDYTNMALISIRWLVDFLPINYDTLLSYKDKFISIFKRMFPKTQVEGFRSTEQQSGLVSSSESFFGLLLGIVGTTFGVKQLVDSKKAKDFKEGFLSRLSDVRGLSYFTTSMAFVSMLFTSAQAVMNYIFGLVKPEVAVKKYMLENSSNIAEFIENVEVCTNPLNRKNLKEKKFRVKLWRTTIQANNLKKKLTQLNPNATTSILLNWCNQMIKFTEDNYAAMSCSPVCYEPFVLCLEGLPGIGKSTIQRQIVINLLQAAGYSTGGVEPTYNRCPGLKHWDDFKDEMCVNYDDWLNLTDVESIKEVVSELYQLKSHANFIPPQASIMDKGRPAQPKLVTLLTNNAYPEASLNMITANKEAVYRRRDIVLGCELNGKSNISEFSRDDQRANKHLLFWEMDKFTGEQISEKMTWDQLKTLLCDRFIAYDQKEKEYLVQQLQILSMFGGKSDALNDPTDFIMSYFENRITEDLSVPELYPSHILEKELMRVMDELQIEPLQGNKVEGFSNLWDSIMSFFRTESEEVICNHCGLKKLILYERSNHRVCDDCRVQETICSNCIAPKEPATVSVWTLRGLKTMALNSYSDFKNFVSKNSTAITYLLLMITFKFMGEYARVKAQKSIDNQERDNWLQGTPEVEMEGLKKYIRIENPGPKTQCMHTKTELEQSDYIFENGFWIAVRNGEKIIMPYSQCKPECVLTDEKALERYRLFCNRNFETGKLRSDFLLSRIADNCRNPDDHENYQIVTPPHLRDHTYRLMIPDNYEAPDQPTTSLDFSVFVEDTPTKWSKIFKYLSYGLMAIGALMASLKIINYFIAPKMQIESSGALQTRHFLKAKHKILKVSKTFTQNKEEFKESLDRVVSDNYFVIKLWNDDTLMQFMMGVGIYNRTAIIPRHYYSVMKDKRDSITHISLHSRKNTIAVDYIFDEADFLLSEDADICQWTLPTTMSHFKDIRKFIVKEKDLNSFTNRAYILEGPSRKCEYVKEHDIRILGIAKEEIINSTTESFVATDSLKYTFSKTGACGSLVLLKDTTRPIIAMHFAGRADWGVFSDPVGFGVILTRELFSSEPAISEEEVQVKDPLQSKMLFPIEVQVEHVGALNTPIFNPTKSSILPSRIQPYLAPPLTKPCYLSKSEEGYPHQDSPLFAGCKKHGVLTKNFSTSELKEAQEALWNLSYSKLEPIVCQPTKLTIGEAIKGLGVSGYEPLHMNTSMGYPFRGETQKSAYMEIVRDNHGEVVKVLLEKEVLDNLNRYSELRTKGVRPFLPYIDATKDERKKLAKREKEGSTRIFCMSSIYTTIPVRQNFLHFAAAYTANRFNLQHAVGVSRNGPEWSRLVSYLAEVSLDNVVTLDYSNFGPGYNAMVNAAGHEIITRWTKKYVAGVNDQEMKILGEEHYNSLHVMGDLVYKQYSGGPSGDALTVVKNGLVNELYILLAWKHLMKDFAKEEQVPLYQLFKDNVRLVVYGDDLIMSVSDKIKDKFNGITIQAYFSTKGIVATDALKTGDKIAYTSILQATFLKSGFRPHPTRKGMWLAPIDEDTVEETPKWIRKCANWDEATAQNAEASLRDSFGMGPVKFQIIKDKLNEALIKANLPPLLLTWKELDDMFFPS